MMMWRALSLLFLTFAMMGPFFFLEEADAQTSDAFVAVVNEKSAEALGNIGVFRDQLLRDHATILDQSNKIAELTKELDALKAIPPGPSTAPLRPPTAPLKLPTAPPPIGHQPPNEAPK